ncbi:hypothetical protein AYL99_06873 [Fonsecaea erecta]|uniref:3-oxoacyl-[acyl-carrier protein] reductase n=1 Tax=Fonsecaea erecta TaxID=1367422 RepID=A0A178ZKM3_9EURO|nr:hypothetical protein AYL99_06873 [Fonsecaea erecta]OAP59575.1 hypothetical protein AYL99_06873 [Fonsecaea erecta]
MSEQGPKGRLAGKTAIVTGAASGFGAAIATIFANEGALVLAADINTAGGEAIVAKHPNLHFFKLNVTLESEWQAALDCVLSRWGKIDILVNNAGTSHRNQPALDVTKADFERCIAVNVDSVFHSVKVVVRKMVEQGTGGSVINISSIGSVRPRPGLVWYNATKGAVSNATKGLAAEFGPHKIRFNCICPLLSGTGLFETFVGVPDTPENRQKFIGNVPLGRLTDVNDIGYAALYLASDESAFVTGINMEVDGGRGV